MSLRNIHSSFRRRKQESLIATRVVLMDNSCVEEKFDKASCLTGVAILRRFGERLSIPEAELKYFGLKYPDSDGHMNWLALSDHVKKQLGKKAYHFQLGVRFYPEANGELSENCLRLCCYQVKCDFIRGYLSCDPVQHAAIDSYFAQAIVGDFKAKSHQPGYLEDFLGLFFMLPSGINCSTEVNAREYEMNVTKRHQGHAGMTTKEAWLALLNMISTVPHFNALKHQAKDCCDKTKVQILVSERGVNVYELNKLNEPEKLQRHYEWKDLASLTCYNNKLLVSTSSGKCKFKFSGVYGDKAASRALDDMLECRLFANCNLLGTSPMSYHSEESNGGVGNELSRRSSKFPSFRNEPVMKRKNSIRRVYSSVRLRFSKKRETKVRNEGVEDDELGYKSRLSRIEMLPNA